MNFGASLSTGPDSPSFAVVGFAPSKLARFYNSLTNLATNKGRDVIIIGDSLIEGQASVDAAKYSLGRLVGQSLQQWANRRWAPAVVGGRGFIPAYTAGGITQTYGVVNATNGGSFAGGTPSTSLNQPGWGLVRIDTGALATTTLTINQVTDIEFVCQKRMVAVTVPWVATGTGAGSGNLTVGDTNKGPLWDLTKYTTNSTGIFGERRAVLTGMTAGATNTVLTFSAPSADNVRFNGFIAYNGDRSAGLRYHVLARSGFRLYGPDHLACLFRDDEALPIVWDELNFDNKVNTKAGMQANVDQWSYSAPSNTTDVGACRASLIIMEFGTNDQGAYANTGGTVASGTSTFQTYLQAFVDRAISRPSEPCVLLLIPPCPEGREAYWRTFKQAYYNVAAATDHVTLIDLDAYYSNGGRNFPLTWEADAAPNRLHFTTEGSIGISVPVTQTIIAGCPL